MQTIREILMDINNRVLTKLEAKQNDANSRFIQVTLLDGNNVINLTNNTVKIFGVKQDNTKIFNDVEITDATNGVILIELTSQALAVAGELQCELVVYGADSSVLSSKVFTINVLESIRDDGAIESTDEFTALTQGINKLEAWDAQFQSKYDGLNAEYAQQLTSNTNKLGNLSDNGITENSLSEAVKNDRSQIIDIAFNPKQYGVKLDGITDDSDTLQAFFNRPEVQGHVTFPPNSTIFLSKPITVSKDDITIDGNNLTIKWANTYNMGNDGVGQTIGVFTVKRTVESVIGNITNIIPKIVNAEIPTDTVHGGRAYCKITLDNTANMPSAGDYIRFAITTKTTQDYSYLQPSINIVCRVVSIIGANIYLDYSSPYAYGTVFDYAKAYKETVRKNIRIKNMKLLEQNTWNYKSDVLADVPLDVQQKCISLAYFECAINCHVENIYGYNTTNPIVIFGMCTDCTAKNIDVDRPAITVPGHGYGVKSWGGYNILFENIKGNFARHCVDFSGCYYSIARNVNGRYMDKVSFMTHGIYDHDLLFENCNGSTSLSAGISYGSVSMNVTYRNCILNEYSSGYTKGTRFENCEVYILSTNYYGDSNFPVEWCYAEFYDSRVYWTTGGIAGKTRNETVETYLKFVRCDVIFLNWKATSQYLNTFDYIKFYDCKLRMPDNTNTSDTIRSINIDGLKHLYIGGNSQLYNVYFYMNNSKDTFIEFDNVVLIYDVKTGTNQSMINSDYGSSKRTVRFSNLKCNYTGAGTLRLIRIGGTATSTQNEKLIVNGCYITSATTNLISIFAPNNGTIATNNTVIQGNTFVNVNAEGFNKTAYPNNLWI